MDNYAQYNAGGSRQTHYPNHPPHQAAGDGSFSHIPFPNAETLDPYALNLGAPPPPLQQAYAPSYQLQDAFAHIPIMHQGDLTHANAYPNSLEAVAHNLQTFHQPSLVPPPHSFHQSQPMPSPPPPPPAYNPHCLPQAAYLAPQASNIVPLSDVEHLESSIQELRIRKSNNNMQWQPTEAKNTDWQQPSAGRIAHHFSAHRPSEQRLANSSAANNSVIEDINYESELSTQDKAELKKLVDDVQKSKPNHALTPANKKDIDVLFRQRKHLAMLEEKRGRALRHGKTHVFVNITNKIYELECNMIPKTHIVQEYVINQDKDLDAFHGALDEAINHYQTHADANNPSGRHQVRVKYTSNASEAANGGVALGILGVKAFFELTDTVGQIFPGAPLIGKALQAASVYLQTRQYNQSIQERTKFTSTFNSDFEDMQASVFGQVVLNKMRHEQEITAVTTGHTNISHITNRNILIQITSTMNSCLCKVKDRFNRTKYKDAVPHVTRPFGFICGKTLFDRMMHKANSTGYSGNDKKTCITYALNAMLEDFGLNVKVTNDQVAYGNYGI
jgi:hypothetical protein